MTLHWQWSRLQIYVYLFRWTGVFLCVSPPDIEWDEHDDGQRPWVSLHFVFFRMTLFRKWRCEDE